MDASLIWRLVLAVVGVPLLLSGYIILSERFMKKRDRRSGNLRAVFWLAPAFILIIVFYIYPTITTTIMSFKDANSEHFVGLENFVHIFTDRNMLIVLRNNVVWLVVFTLATLTLGLVLAILTDRVRYESAAKSIIFLPMAISYVASGVIWKFMYDYQPQGMKQIGTLNALLTALIPGFEPKAWLFDTQYNNQALILVGIWMWTGYAMVILSAGLKSIPTDIIEAARIDGASETQILRRITLPMLAPTITVVATTLIIDVLKIFDIVYVMTNGNLDTDVIANRMYKEMFNYHNYGRASAMAVILLVVIVPIMIMNIRRARKGGANA
ncbi:MAG: sugar ABC transporter permease [Spirochaetaceae bacterium]|nr:sugar ABC transporter permease [Spirochaetaceae bacterium]